MNKNLLLRAMLISSACFLGSSRINAQNHTLVIPVHNGNDDAEECIPGGTGTVGDMDLGSSDLELMTDGSKRQIIGIRFSGVNIPQGATIVRAYVQFTAKGDKSPVNGDIHITAQNSTNAAIFEDTDFNITSRSQIPDSVLWAGSTSSTWGTASGGVRGAEQRTPDISTVLQPLFDNPTWSLGNALVVLFKGEGVRNAYSYDGNLAYAPELIIEYTGAPISPLSATPLPVQKNSDWKYLDNGTDQGTAWTTLSFADGAWSYGPGILGYDDNAVTTLSYGPDPANKYITYYFRKKFMVADVTALADSLDISILRDDGAIVYINGTEVARTNMPASATYLTPADLSTDGSDEITYYIYRIPKTALINGENILAAEVHQIDGTSPDLGFDLELKEMPSMVITHYPVSANSEWKYLDNGTDQGTAWKEPTFDDNGWNYGSGKLGYSDAPATTLSYGPDAGNKYITYYFRKKIIITDTAALTDSVELKLLRDDGAIVYINGAEAVRSNMPADPINYMTFSSTIVDGGDESVYNSYYIPRSMFVNDTNTIAVEVHQRDGTSSDLGFDISVQNYTAPPEPVDCGPLPSDHISSFTSVFPSAQPDSIRIPATHTFQMIVQSGDPYTNPALGNTKGLFDFTGYVPIGGSSTNGYLSINHEETGWPEAGVSMLQIQFDDANKTWDLISNEPVDFSGVQGTGRNCSGTVTPWNTIITCEEILPSTDADSDGHFDVGWAVEINPVTKQVVDHDGDGNPDKLWQVGRMSHENVVVAPDQKTLYEGNDENPGYIFRFVADVAGQLGEGTLYVLKLDGALESSTTGSWIAVPTSTPTERNNVRDFAASVSATNFNQIEDVEISPLDSMVYFTSKSSSRVYRFKDNGTTVNNFGIFVGNSSSVYSIDYGTGIASEQWRDGNDNLTFDDEGNLYVIQDGGRNHVWMVKPCHTAAAPAVELFAVTPAGSEPTGMTFSPDYKFMFLSIQHPSGSNATEMLDANGDMVTFNKESAIVIARREFLGPEAALPVSFISFNAYKADNKHDAILDWSFNQSGIIPATFEIQRMTLGSSFQTIHTIATGIPGNNPFRYTDEQPFLGKNFYRIRAKDEAGKEVFTTVKMVNFESLDQLSIAGIYPNPTSDKVNIALVSPELIESEISLYNNLGVKVKSLLSNIVKGNNVIELDMSDLPAGVYLLQIDGGNTVLNNKIIKK